MNRKGIIYFVGAGPGDPGLLTVRGRELLQQAQVVVVDALANHSLLREATHADIIYVGKRGPGAPKGSSRLLPQAGINGLLIKLAKKGLRVVRLKGGDPFVFGRGGEEAEALAKAKVRYHIIPGVTSATAVPAYVGIPVSDRRWASHVTFLTGQEGMDEKASHVKWTALSQDGTLVILMGVSRWPVIQKKLLASGWSKNKPVAAIESGTTSQQKKIITTLGKSISDFKRKKLAAPAIIVVGEVVRLSSKLDWVHKEKPLLERKIVVTRAVDQNQRLTRLLHDKGADVVLCPAIATHPLVGDPEIERVVLGLATKKINFDWIVFLSGNGVKTFSAALGNHKNKIKGIKICAVGPQTKEVILAEGWKVTKTAKQFNSQGLLDILKPVRNKRLLIPRVQGGPQGFIRELIKKGAHVDELSTYRTISAEQPAISIKRLLLSGVDAITFTSPSTVHHFCRFFNLAERKKIFKSALALSIGPTTTQALKQWKIPRLRQAKKALVEEMVFALCKNFSK